ncbi:polysialyltransferase family glycosyltransferase [Acinetobacter sp. TSRC1-2]|uniref:polysialyltransferase family glycosyltransferase n=1 Tax=unclassified Acinetobacter TaxID=196816 RepID=UPI003CEE71C3
MNKFLLYLSRKKNSKSIFNFREGFDYYFFESLKINTKKNDYLGRSFLQYKCQIKDEKKIINLLIVLLIPIFILIPVILLIIFNKKKLKQSDSKIIAVLPESKFLPKVFDNKEVFWVEKSYKRNFNFKDLIFCYTFIFKYLFFPYFWLKCLYIVLSYSGIVKTCAKEILVSNEYSFTSSILTKYINSYGKICSNCMHGEKVLCLRDCFSTYDKFYVWDDFYIKVLREMDVQAKFIVSSCSALDLELSQNEGDIIFFLQGFEDIADLEVIHKKMNKLSELYSGNIFVKPHPRYPNSDLNIVFKNDEILNIPFEDAVKMAKIVVSNYSTVLFQVYINKKLKQKDFPVIVINDLVKLPPMYIMQEKAEIFFSKL